MEIVIAYLLAAVAVYLLWRQIRKPSKFKNDPADDYADLDDVPPPRDDDRPGRAQP